MPPWGDPIGLSPTSQVQVVMNIMMEHCREGAFLLGHPVCVIVLTGAGDIITTLLVDNRACWFLMVGGGKCWP